MGSTPATNAAAGLFGLGDIDPSSPQGLMLLQMAANRINQTTPSGRLEFTGPGRSESELTLSPEMQRIFDLEVAAAEAAKLQGTAAVGSLDYGADFGASRDAATRAAFARGRGLLDPVFELQEKRRRTDLINRGIVEGSEAFRTDIRENIFDPREKAYLALAQESIGAGLKEFATLEDARTARVNQAKGLLGLGGAEVPELRDFFAPSEIDVIGAETTAIAREKARLTAAANAADVAAANTRADEALQSQMEAAKRGQITHLGAVGLAGVMGAGGGGKAIVEGIKGLAGPSIPTPGPSIPTWPSVAGGELMGPGDMYGVPRFAPGGVGIELASYQPGVGQVDGGVQDAPGVYRPGERWPLGPERFVSPDDIPQFDLGIDRPLSPEEWEILGPVGPEPFVSPDDIPQFYLPGIDRPLSPEALEILGPDLSQQVTAIEALDAGLTDAAAGGIVAGGGIVGGALGALTDTEGVGGRAGGAFKGGVRGAVGAGISLAASQAIASGLQTGAAYTAGAGLGGLAANAAFLGPGAAISVAAALAQAQSRKRSLTANKQAAEMREFAMPVTGVVDSITRGTGGGLLVNDQEFASIQQAVGTSDPIGIPGSHAGASAASAGTTFLKKYPALLNISGMSDMDDVKGNAIRQAGRLATLTRIPGIGAAWDSFYNGKITQGEFKTRSQKALAEYKNSPAYRNVIGKVTERANALKTIARFMEAEEADPDDGADPRLTKKAQQAQASLDASAEPEIRKALKRDNPGAGVFGDGTPEAIAYKAKLRRDLSAIEARRIQEKIRQTDEEDRFDSRLQAQLRRALEGSMTDREWDEYNDPME